MLPSLHQLAPTGEFYALPRREAQRLNEENDGDPWTGEMFPANCHRDARNCEPTFRVWVADPATGNKGTGQYYVYFARTLWDWYQRQPTDPNNRQFCWSEDWWALHTKYDPDGEISPWVEHLPMYNRVRQLAEERRIYLTDLHMAMFVHDEVSSIHLHSLAQVLGGPDGTLMPDGSNENEVEDVWMVKFLYERALRVARRLLETGALDIIAHHLRTQRHNLGDPSQHKWAAQLLKSLLKALGQRWEGPSSDLTEHNALIGRVLGMPDLLRGLANYAHWIAMRRAEAFDEDPWELVPLQILFLCAGNSLRNDDWRQATALATDRLLDTLELVFRPRPGGDSADMGYDVTCRYTSKQMALRIVQYLSMNSSPRVRSLLIRRELLLAVTKFSMLQLDENDDGYEELEEFRSVAAGVLMRLSYLSPNAEGMVNEVGFEVGLAIPADEF